MTYNTRFVLQTSITAPASLTTKRISKQARLNAIKSVLFSIKRLGAFRTHYCLFGLFNFALK